MKANKLLITFIIDNLLKHIKNIASKYQNIYEGFKAGLSSYQ